MKKFKIMALAIAMVSAAGVANAQFAKPEDAIKYRQSAFFVMMQNFSRVAAMAQGKIPYDAKVAIESSSVAEFTGKLPWTAFEDGTDKGNTKAKGEVWTDRTKFNDYAKKMEAELVKVSAAAKTSDLGNIKAVIGSAIDTCKTCHDSFKNK